MKTSKWRKRAKRHSNKRLVYLSKLHDYYQDKARYYSVFEDTTYSHKFYIQRVEWAKAAIKHLQSIGR